MIWRSAWVPTRRPHEPYTWLWRGTKHHEWSWWLLVPYRIQRWWVHRENVRVCAVRGHSDFAWHMREEFWPGTDKAMFPEMRCQDCCAPIDGCTGVGHFHRDGTKA